MFAAAVNVKNPVSRMKINKVFCHPKQQSGEGFPDGLQGFKGDPLSQKMFIRIINVFLDDKIGSTRDDSTLAEEN